MPNEKNSDKTTGDPPPKGNPRKQKQGAEPAKTPVEKPKENATKSKATSAADPTIRKKAPKQQLDDVTLVSEMSQRNDLISLTDSRTSDCVSDPGFLCAAANFPELEDGLLRSGDDDDDDDDDDEEGGIEYTLLAKSHNRIGVVNDGCSFSCGKRTNVRPTTIYEDQVLHTLSEASEGNPPLLVPIRSADSSVSSSSSSSTNSGSSTSSASSSSSASRSVASRIESTSSGSSASSTSSAPSVASSESSSSFSATEITRKYSSAGKSVVTADGTVTPKEHILERIKKASREKVLLEIQVEDDESAYSVLEITRKYTTVGRTAASGCDQVFSKNPIIQRMQRKPSSLKDKTVQFDDGECSRSLSLFTNSSDEEDEEEDEEKRDKIHKRGPHTSFVKIREQQDFSPTIDESTEEQSVEQSVDTEKATAEKAKKLPVIVSTNKNNESDQKNGKRTRARGGRNGKPPRISVKRLTGMLSSKKKDKSKSS